MSDLVNQNTGHTYTRKSLVVHLKFKFHWGSCILPGNPTLGAVKFRVKSGASLQIKGVGLPSVQNCSLGCSPLSSYFLFTPVSLLKYNKVSCSCGVPNILFGSCQSINFPPNLVIINQMLHISISGHQI